VLSFGRDGKELRRREQNTVAGEKDDDEEDGVEMSVILPESEETVANIFSALGKPDEDPHWADVWHGGIALNEYLVISDVARGSLVRGKRVLELGGASD